MAIDDYFVEQGRGAPIVFIHGSFANTSTWKYMVSQLSDRYRCICIKQPGHGGAPAPEDFDNPSVDTEVDIVVQVIEYLRLGPIHLVAHSFGGVVAVAVALSGRVALRAMTLFEPVLTGILEMSGRDEDAAAVDRFCNDYRTAIASQETYACRRVIDFWGGEGQFEQMPEFIKEAMDPLTDYNARHWDLCQNTVYALESYESFDVPTQLVCGDKSSPIVRSISECLLKHLGNARMDILFGASHFLVTSHAEKSFDFVRQVESLTNFK